MPRKAKAEPDPHQAWLKSLPRAVLELACWDGWPHFEGGTLVIACSGGRDSVSLAHAAWSLLVEQAGPCSAHLAQRWKLPQPYAMPELVLWHYDHGLRADSAADAHAVAELGLLLGLRTALKNGQLREHPQFGKQNTAALARRMRYAALTEATMEEARRIFFRGPFPETEGIRRINVFAWTAHHLRDQAETVLFNLVRGSGLLGLAGMSPGAPSNSTYRPWLDLDPKFIQQYAEDHNLEWRDDPTNASSATSRGLIRHQVLPLLEQINAETMQHILTASIQAGEAYHTLLNQGAKNGLVDLGERAVGVLPIAAQPEAEYHVVSWPELAADSFELWLAFLPFVRAWTRGLSHEAVWQFRDWLRGAKSRLSLGGGHFTRRRGWLEFLRWPGGLEHAAVPEVALAGNRTKQQMGLCEVEVSKLGRRSAQDTPVKARSSDDRWDQLLAYAAIEPDWEDEKIPEGVHYRCSLPAAVKLPLRVRTWRHGDRLTLASGQHRKLSDIFIDCKVPAPFRRDWLVLVDAADEPLWVPGLADSQTMGDVQDRGAALLVDLYRPSPEEVDYLHFSASLEQKAKH